jgi:polyisoprenoid-binding protein YceI
MSRVKNLICLIIIFSLSAASYAQQKLMVDHGKINFVSNAPLEIIKATSEQMKMMIEPSTNQIVLTVPINTFKGFNGRLQQDHFNEKYMESDKYPNATFKGKIIENVDFHTDGIYDVRAKGELEVHGQKQTRIIRGKITVKNGAISITTDFKIPLSDYNITVPSIISEKIASEIAVSVYALVSRVE